ncbi:MAG: ABC-type sugar transport system periplasmic component-like protein [Aeromicrobium sp.]|nr:ABC-type sugar transport system periplasmic component-like protein [Aeromicrobium sp.]
MNNVRRTKTGLMALALSGMLAASGCGGSDEGSSSGGDAGGGAGAYVTEAQQAVDAAYKGLYAEPTEGSPAQKGKSVYVVTCGQALPGCALPAASVKEAGAKLGWDVKILDGKTSPAVYASSIQQAIAAKADGIITVAIDCSAAKSALKAAKDAKIPTTGFYAFDCNDPKADAGESLYTDFIKLHDVPSAAEWYVLGGKLQADYAIAKTEGKAKVIRVTHPDFVNTLYQHDGFTDEIAKCTSCDVVDTLEIPASDLATPAVVAQKVDTVLQQHPEANAIVFPDDTVVLQAAQVLRKLPKEMVVVGGEGDPNALNLVRDGVVDVEIAQPQDWIGWGLAATMNELIAGSELPDSGVSFQMIDKDNGLPETDENWKPTVDYRAAYTAQWAK